MWGSSSFYTNFSMILHRDAMLEKFPGLVVCLPDLSNSICPRSDNELKLLQKILRQLLFRNLINENSKVLQNSI